MYRHYRHPRLVVFGRDAFLGSLRFTFSWEGGIGVCVWENICGGWVPSRDHQHISLEA